MQDNQGKCCHALIKQLESDQGARHCRRIRPELKSWRAPIDLAFTLAGARYAVEHTRVEAFEGQVEFERAFDTLAAPISKHFEEQPLSVEGWFHIVFPIDTKVGRQNLEPAREAIIAWVRETALRFAREVPRRVPTEINPRGVNQQAQQKFFGLNVRLTRILRWNMSRAHDGRVGVARSKDGDTEAQRLQRLKAQLPKKLRNLGHWKARGATTILLLENGDIALTNEIVVSEAVQRCLRMTTLRGLRPDAIYLIDTYLQEWQLNCVKSPSQVWLHNRRFPDPALFSSDQLQDLTPPVGRGAKTA